MERNVVRGGSPYAGESLILVVDGKVDSVLDQRNHYGRRGKRGVTYLRRTLRWRMEAEKRGSSVTVESDLGFGGQTGDIEEVDLQ